MKSKIALFLTIIMGLVALMAVPTLAAEEMEAVSGEDTVVQEIVIDDLIAEAPKVDGQVQEPKFKSEKIDFSFSVNEMNRLKNGETITKSKKLIDEATGVEYEIISEMGPVPNRIERANLGNHNGWYFNRIFLKVDNDNFAYYRIEFLITSPNYQFVNVREAPYESLSYMGRRSVGGVTLTDWSCIDDTNMITQKAWFKKASNPTKTTRITEIITIQNGQPVISAAETLEY